MNIKEIATKVDLQELEERLVKRLRNSDKGIKKQKFLRSREVQKMLGVSSSGLQNLRLRGSIPFIKLDGIILYDYEEILKTLEVKRHNADGD